MQIFWRWHQQISFIVSKRCWIHGWLGKIQWNIITIFTRKRRLYSHLNMEDNTDADYTYLERVNKDFVKKLGEYHDLYVQNDALLLSDLFGNFQKLSWNIQTQPYSFSCSTKIRVASTLK